MGVGGGGGRADGKGTLRIMSKKDFFRHFIRSRGRNYRPSNSFGGGNLASSNTMGLERRAYRVLTRYGTRSTCGDSRAARLMINCMRDKGAVSFATLSTLTGSGNCHLVICLTKAGGGLIRRAASHLVGSLVNGGQRGTSSCGLRGGPGMKRVSRVVDRVRLDSGPVVLVPLLGRTGCVKRLVRLFRGHSFGRLVKRRAILVVSSRTSRTSLGTCKGGGDGAGKGRTSAACGTVLRVETTLPNGACIRCATAPRTGLLVDVRSALSPRDRALLAPNSKCVNNGLCFNVNRGRRLCGYNLMGRVPPGSIFRGGQGVLAGVPRSLISTLVLRMLTVTVIIG